jgi:hypothetical protein
MPGLTTLVLTSVVSLVLASSPSMSNRWPVKRSKLAA